jgi:hypothetical protein
MIECIESYLKGLIKSPFYLKSKVFRLKKEGSPDMAKFFLQQKKAGVRNDYGNKAVSEI